MRSNWWLFASGIALLIAHTPRIEAASFDCSKAATTVEFTICGDEQIGLLDETMADAYRRARGSALDVRALVAEQRAWLAERNACRTKPCLTRLYEQRIAALGFSASSADTAPRKASVTSSASPSPEVPVESEAAVLDDPIEQTDMAVPAQTNDPAEETPSDGVLEASIAPADVATPSPEPNLTATVEVPASPLPGTISEPASAPREVDTASAPADAASASVTADSPAWWRDYLPRNGETPEEWYGRHPIVLNWLAGYVLVSGLFGLMLVRPPLMRWYRSQFWLVTGTGPVDILLRKIGFRLGFEFFIYVVACAIGAIGGWLLVFFIRPGKQSRSPHPSMILTENG